jgi:hypothetical protein
VAVLVAVHPILYVVLLLVSWEMAASQLGQDPIPYQHDPQFLGAPIRLFHVIWLLLMLTALPALVLSLRIAAFRRGSTRRWLRFAPLAAWIISVAVVVANWDAFVWFFD